MINQIRVFGIAALTLLLAACGDNAKLTEQASEGANPPLPPPQHSMIPAGEIIDSKGDLLVADDVGNAVWRVHAAASTASRQ